MSSSKSKFNPDANSTPKKKTPLKMKTPETRADTPWAVVTKRTTTPTLSLKKCKKKLYEKNIGDDEVLVKRKRSLTMDDMRHLQRNALIRNRTPNKTDGIPKEKYSVLIENLYLKSLKYRTATHMIKNVWRRKCIERSLIQSELKELNDRCEKIEKKITAVQRTAEQEQLKHDEALKDINDKIQEKKKELKLSKSRANFAKNKETEEKTVLEEKIRQLEVKVSELNTNIEANNANIEKNMKEYENINNQLQESQCLNKKLHALYQQTKRDVYDVIRYFKAIIYDLCNDIKEKNNELEELNRLNNKSWRDTSRYAVVKFIYFIRQLLAPNIPIDFLPQLNNT